ncbi:MAG: RNA polymerase sigma factor [Burkholderiales bacterium]
MLELHEEAACIARAAAGQQAAFAQLVQAHQGYLRRLLARLCGGDTARADDLAQEAFMKAWRALPSFRGEARFRTWLTRIAYSALAAERRPQALPLDSEAPELPVSDFSPGVDWRLDLDRAMTLLNEKERDALLLCFAGDLSHSEAALVLGWPLGTVKTQVLRARNKLRTALKDWSPE